MKPFHTHKGTVVALMNDNIDTDQIIPKQYLKRIERTGFGQFLFDEWRYNDDRSDNPTFPLNVRKSATILVSGENFGCGSSREHAPWALDDYGFRVIIAGSFADIFYMNCTKNGILPVVLGQKERNVLANLGPDEEVEVDLEKQTIQTANESFSFEIEPVWKEKLLLGLDDIAVTLQYKEDIERFEQHA